ncbi:MAG TPA: hypothetical protein VFU49_12880 [Ktedonobacteraceae bacterium]|nr:hypothetical protein [Ktedonobacteraceae bacterium]
MAREAEIMIHLDNIHDLFIRPIEDPFARKANFLSGVEMIRRELTATLWGLRARVRTTIFLPEESIEPDLANQIRVAMQRYCRFKLEQNKYAMVTLRRQALMALLLGMLFLVGGVLLSQFLERITFLPPYLSTVFSDGFVIAFWVILWRPVDFFLFELWPFWKEDRIYKQMMAMEINIAEE